MTGRSLLECVNGRNVLHGSALIDRPAYMYSADDLIDLVNNHQSVSLFRMHVTSYEGRDLSYAPRIIRHNIEALQLLEHNGISSKIDLQLVVSAGCGKTEKECIANHS